MEGELKRGPNCIADRPSLTLVSPYNPMETHYHAAENMLIPALTALTNHYRVTVIAPALTSESRGLGRVLPQGLSVRTVSPPSPSRLRFLGVYPAGARKDWTKPMTREAVELVREINSDYLHIEYLQPLEVGLASGRSFSMTLHDLGSVVYRQRVDSSRNHLERLYRIVEWARVARLESVALRATTATVCLSERDAVHLRKRGVDATAVRIGVSADQYQWHPAPSDRPRIVFAGALWRDANSATARWLLTEVWPLVLASVPTAVMSIVGKGSPNWLELLICQTPNAELIGEVPSIEAEYVRAQLVLAPSILDAGILLKAVTAMATGAPVVFNSTSAAPVGVTAGVNAFIGHGAPGYAAAIVKALSDWNATIAIARAGQAYVRRQFSWSQYGQSMKEVLG